MHLEREAILKTSELDAPVWRSALTDEDVMSQGGTFRVAALLAKLPSAVVAN